MSIEIRTNIEPPLEISIDAAVWASVVIRGARSLNASELTVAVGEGYNGLREALREATCGDSSSPSQIVRMWNYIPGITETLGEAGNDRYMAFNAGRYAAMSGWFGQAQLLSHAPAASGVGIVGDNLIVHAMTAPQAGVALQNPRQTPAVDYSLRYGPRPPCFARATRVGRTLLVSGTAAIRGEATVAQDLPGQLQTTLENLAALTPAGLAAYTSMRVFLPDISNKQRVLSRLMQSISPDCQVTFTPADLCRRELLVEIEGVASDSSTHD